MTDSLLQVGLSNTCLSLVIAIAAVIAGAIAKRPHLAHMLWLLVFVKLLTPPLIALPVISIADHREPATTVEDAVPSALVTNQAAGAERTTVGSRDAETSGTRRPIPAGNESSVSWLAPASVSMHDADLRDGDMHANSIDSWWARYGPTVVNLGRRWLPSLWLLGSVLVGTWSLFRVYRFNRLLAKHTEIAPRQLREAAATIARRLRLKNVPKIYTTSARLSPLVWWTGGKVRIIIPASLLDQMEARQWQWILAHELAHVRRRDYLVRWLEWLACVCFWWNPVVWWAQRHLRAVEEICCDALVLTCLRPKPNIYANSLLSAVEFLARPALRPPAMASEINSGGVLERRFRMIVAKNPPRTSSRRLRACVLLFAMLVLPFGLANAQDVGAVAERLGEAVEQGELSKAQASAMMSMLKKQRADKPGDKDKRHEHFQKIKAKLKAAVAAGKLSAEDAKAKLAAIKKAKLGSVKKTADPKAVDDRLKAAVKAGKLTKDEAWAKWKGMTKDKADESKAVESGDKDKRHEHFQKIKAKLKAAVAAGKLSAEDAKAKLAAIKKAELGSVKKTADPKAVDDRLKAAVKAGKLTKDEAWAKWKGITKDKADESKADYDAKKPKYKGDGLHASGEHLRRIGDRLRKAVEQGKLSKEEARQKWQAIKKQAAQNENKK